jgi:hypothetical protein
MKYFKANILTQYSQYREDYHILHEIGAGMVQLDWHIDDFSPL